MEMFNILDKLGATAMGPDGIPAWFLRIAAPVVAAPIAHLFNMSLSQACVPTQWKTARIVPIAKIKKTTGCADFRPLSITSILSRLIEKRIVREFLYPVLNNPPSGLVFEDQYAFRPTGSTTSIIVAMLAHITDLLRSSDYVVMISLDFSKAFDTIRHHALFQKYASLGIKDDIYNWLINYFQDRMHSTGFKGEVSEYRKINASIVQGSGLGPFSFIVAASDLVSTTKKVRFFKYADDTYLIANKENACKILNEINNIEKWADQNNLKLNKGKTKEIIFYAKRGKHKISEVPCVPGIERVTEIKALGVTLQSDLQMNVHVGGLLASCSGSLYALKQLRAGGMPPRELQEVFKAKIQSRIMYATQAWVGFAQASIIARIEAFFKRCKRFGYCSDGGGSFVDLCDRADDQLFAQILLDEGHILRAMLPVEKSHDHNLRKRKHNFTLPAKDDRNFINRMLFKGVF